MTCAMKVFNDRWPLSAENAKSYKCEILRYFMSAEKVLARIYSEECAQGAINEIL